ARLKEKFGYPSFRTYNGAPLQEDAVRAAVEGKSILTIFPTGGGKSLTFQLPALIGAETEKGLTVVISPLQSLMKDQVDGLSEKGISDAVTINGLLNVLERKEAIERVQNGIASILYIAPESLRSKTIQKLLESRNVIRFVIDEAHCFSSWGQDFRVDYLYIGDYIQKLQTQLHKRIPVSCFTATAKQKVISDIREYFMQKLGVELELYTTDAARTNLRYEVIYREDKNEKYKTLRELLEQKNCPTIVYTSRTKRTENLADRLFQDGFNARPYHGKMDQEEKIRNQDDFISGKVQIIVATSAFGMGVDKSDVGLVVHFDISDSLENYVQEAGRAGRNENLKAECYVLFNEDDLNGHFTFLNQTKLTVNEIQQVWRGIKLLAGKSERILCSAFDIAKSAGWLAETNVDLETKVRTAVQALEQTGYIKRGDNSPRVYADSLMINNVAEARERIEYSGLFSEKDKEDGVLLIQRILSERSVDRKDPVTRVDYLADVLGFEKERVICLVDLFKDAGILADDKEMSVFLEDADLNRKTSNRKMTEYLRLEQFLFEVVTDRHERLNYKELNETAEEKGIKSDPKMLKELVHFWTISGYIRKPTGETNHGFQPDMILSPSELEERIRKRQLLCDFIEKSFISDGIVIRDSLIGRTVTTIKVDFSTVDLKRRYDAMPVGYDRPDMSNHDFEETLLFLSKIRAFRMEGGFLVIYNRMEIHRQEMNNLIKYKKEDYKQFEEYYKLKMQQIHIVGEFANMIVRDYGAALTFVHDYFQMEYGLFLKKYFAGFRMREINRNITPQKYDELFLNLTDRQAEVINDDESKMIVVAAGPGSGKTKILVHKLASLVIMEDVKYEQLLMLTFSRAAATEFKARLHQLIGNAAKYVEIKTFHSYAFDLLGKIGTVEKSANVISDVTKRILEDEVEEERITKTVLVLDEAQDISRDEYRMIQALREKNEDMRVIAVGDDDQNIYEFRGSKSKYLQSFAKEEGAKLYELTQNFRSKDLLVQVTNAYLQTMSERMKTEDICSVNEGQGFVDFVRYERENGIEQELIRVFENWHKPEHSTAILTSTNEQAYLCYDLLFRKGLRPRLIHEAEGFKLYDLDEFRFFTEEVHVEEEPRISEERWEKAIAGLKDEYGQSEKLENVLYTLECFRKATPEPYYYDLIEFLIESRFDDFYKCDKGEICISTIHKAKGHEYDDVFLLLSALDPRNEETKRVIYVGMTRAKEGLYVVYTGIQFGKETMETYKQLGAGIFKDSMEFPVPTEIILPLSHKDIWLDYPIDPRLADKRYFAGQELEIEEEGGRLFFRDPSLTRARVVAVSEAFVRKLQVHKSKGYMPVKAYVNYVAYWTKTNGDEPGVEKRIILPRVILKKESRSENGR
ncbi:MAG: RecQ family ATP-dependent DNA helicase, partial [Eubacterium sp.]|nr:RecQ family ATP-dependent DNA helicase [Eubacterium sp.]